MIKKLKIRFVKFERALVAQQLETTGKEHFTPSEHVVLSASGIDFADAAIWLSRSCNINIGLRHFLDNAERDEYLNNVIKWISEEQFATGGKLKIGKECEVSDSPYPKNNEWKRKKLLAILPKRIRFRYITESISSDTSFCTWINARPIASFVRPKIDGDVYTWEMEVAQ